MIRLNHSCKLTWIDHHASSFERRKRIRKYFYETEGKLVKKINGRVINSDITREAACEMTWKYLYPKLFIPYGVYLLGRYDIWEHIIPDVELFQMGLKTENTHPYYSMKLWNQIFKSNPHSKIIKKYIEKGKIITKYIDEEKEKIKGICFEHLFMGKYNAIVANKPFSNSSIFDKMPDDYDLKILFYKNKNIWTYSIYSAKINVREIAEQYGGGGHEHAAGFELDKNIFD